MKTYTEFVNLNTSPTDINETTMRTASAAALTFRVRSLNTKLKNIIIHPNDNQSVSLDKINQKLNILSDQVLFQSFLTTQLGVMK